MITRSTQDSPRCFSTQASFHDLVDGRAPLRPVLPSRAYLTPVGYVDERCTGMLGPERVKERSLEVGYGPVLIDQHQAHNVLPSAAVRLACTGLIGNPSSGQSAGVSSRTP